MKNKQITGLGLVLLLFLAACAPTTPLPATATATPTPTPTLTVTPPPTQTPASVTLPQDESTATPVPQPTVTATSTPQPSTCRELSGSLEVQILVGPSDAVGLTPRAVGTLPWRVVTDAPPYLLAGDTGITYQDTLTEDWGSFDVQMSMDFTVEGTCDDTGDGTLDMAVTMDGEQTITVTSEGFSAQYPWSGTETRNVTFPIEEGATVSGEGWAFVLHLD